MSQSTSLDDILSNSPQTVLKEAFLFSILFHALLLGILSAHFFAQSKELIIPKQIQVHSVALHPHHQHNIKKPPLLKTPPPPQPISSRKEETHVEEIARNIDTTPSKEAPTPSTESPSKKEQIKKAAVPSEKEPVKKNKTKETPSSQLKKETPSQKEAKTTRSKKEESEKPSRVNKEVAANIQSLLAKAKQQRGKAASSHNATNGSSGPLCSALHELSFEGADGEEDGGEEEATAEELYVGHLIRLIQLGVTIPEKEPVSLKLTLFKTGLIKSIIVLSSPSHRNRQAIERGMKALRYPSFNTAFLGQKEHTFTLKLTKEMEWMSAAK